MSEATEPRSPQYRRLTATERTFERPEVTWPLVVEAGRAASSDSLVSYCVQEKAELRHQLNVHGALLFRGFNVASTQQFRAVLDGLGVEPSPFPYAGNTLRDSTGPSVSDVTYAPPWTSIFPHNEMFYWFRQPRFISFFSEQCEGTQGETTVVDCRRVWTDLPDATKRVLETARFFVESRYASEEVGRKNPLSLGTQLANTWQSVAGSPHRSAFEAHVAEGRGKVSWARDGSVRVKMDNALVVAHPETGEAIFRGLSIDPLVSTRLCNRNMLHRMAPIDRLKCRGINVLLSAASRLQRRIGLVGGRLTRAQVREIYEIVWRHTSLFRWREGDVMVLDNLSMGHGRLGVGGPRTLHVAIGGEVSMRSLLSGRAALDGPNP